MIRSYHKEKAYNAIAYFLDSTTMCNKKKLFKLLWLFDSEHFQSVGRSVTGYEYQAWQMGPVPVELHNAMQTHDPDLLEHFEIEIIPGKGNKKTISLRSKRPFEAKYFSEKQATLLEDLANRFGMMSGDDMEKWTHQPGTPWHRVWMVENKKNAPIPYEYALDNLEPKKREVISHIAKEREAFLSSHR